MTTTTLNAPASSTASPTALLDTAYLLGRIAIGLLFIWSGYSKLAYMDGNIGYMAAYGLPFASLAIWPAAFVELIGGAAIALGWKVRWSALALIAFTAVATAIFHAYWAVPADQILNQQIHFMKNIAIIGALLSVGAYGNGRYAIERTER
jgi:putative oxidoreductase